MRKYLLETRQFLLQVYKEYLLFVAEFRKTIVDYMEDMKPKETSAFYRLVRCYLVRFVIAHIMLHVSSNYMLTSSSLRIYILSSLQACSHFDAIITYLKGPFGKYNNGEKLGKAMAVSTITSQLAGITIFPFLFFKFIFATYTT